MLLRSHNSSLRQMLQRKQRFLNRKISSLNPSLVVALTKTHSVNEPAPYERALPRIDSYSLFTTTVPINITS